MSPSKEQWELEFTARFLLLPEFESLKSFIKQTLREQLQSLLEELAPDKFYEDNFGEDYVTGIRTIKSLLTTRL